MAPASCVVRYQERDHALSVRVEGRATLSHAAPVRRLAERAVAAGATRAHFDLSACTHLDSTFLGTLLTIKKMLAKVGGHLTLVAPSTACCRILHQMGLVELLPTGEAAAESAEGWAELELEPSDAGAFKGNVMQAHVELAELPGKSGDQFKAVVRAMEQAKKREPEA